MENRRNQTIGKAKTLLKKNTHLSSHGQIELLRNSFKFRDPQWGPVELWETAIGWQPGIGIQGSVVAHG